MFFHKSVCGLSTPVTGLEPGCPGLDSNETLIAFLGCLQLNVDKYISEI